MKKLLLVAFFAMPATFCMEPKDGTGDPIAANLKAELGELITHGKLLKKRVTQESISGAIQKAFGHQGPNHVSYACLDVINQCYAEEVTPEAQAYVHGFLAGLGTTNPGSKEYERIMFYWLRKRFVPQAKL